MCTQFTISFAKYPQIISALVGNKNKAENHPKQMHMYPCYTQGRMLQGRGKSNYYQLFEPIQAIDTF